MSAGPDRVEQLTSLSKAKAFLGREFLTWLWYSVESTDGALSVQLQGEKVPVEFDLWIDDRIALENSNGLAHQSVIKGGDPSQSREAAVSLATGKTVRELKLGMNVAGIGEFSAVLNCDDLNPRSLKLPAPGNQEPARTGSADQRQAPSGAVPLTHRLQMISTFVGILDELFAKFLAVRVAEDWESKGLLSMRDWIKARQSRVASGIMH